MTSINNKTNTAGTSAVGTYVPENTSIFQNILKKYKINSGEDKPITNTRIGEPTFNIYGGSYSIPDEEYGAFLKTYYNEIVSKNQNEYLTEKQLVDDGPLLVDIDLRFPYECNERRYTREHVGDLIELYLSVLGQIYQWDEDTKFNIYLFEKADVNRVQSKNITKDGIHLLFGFQCERATQILLRKMVIERLNEIWEDLSKDNSLGQTNDWDNVLDEGISEGTINWQLYGSCKPNHLSYKLTYIYHVSYCPEDEEPLCVSSTVVKTNTAILKEHFPKLSARYNQHPTFFYSSSFLTKLNEYKESIKKQKNSQITNNQMNKGELYPFRPRKSWTFIFNGFWIISNPRITYCCAKHTNM